MVQHRERWMRAEHRADPDDAECTGAEHRADRGVQRVPAAAQGARRDLIQIADWFKEQDAQDAHGGALNHGGFLHKKGREKVAEQEIVTIGTVLHTAEKPRHSHRMRLHRSYCPAA